jgi:hypothetical protein
MKPIVRRPGSRATLVHEPLNPRTGEWNEEVLQTKLSSVDVQAILKFSIGCLEVDTWAWQLERHGNFTQLEREAWHLHISVGL